MTSSVGAQRWAVVVGATGEIGSAITYRLSVCGYKIAAIARSAESLDAVRLGLPPNATGEIVAFAADVTADDCIDSIRDLIDGPVKVVVHGPGAV